MAAVHEFAFMKKGSQIIGRQNSKHLRNLQTSASMAGVAGGQDEEEIPTANGVANKRPRFSGSARESHPRRQIYQSETVQPSQLPRRVCSSCLLEEEEGVIPLEAESDSDLGSEGFESEEEDDFGSEEDEGSDDVAEAQHQDYNASEAIPVVLTEPEVLDCPICHSPLRSPIYQCENGHVTCAFCTKCYDKCPSCCLPILDDRCRAMEKFLESISVKCKNTRFGCKETCIYHEKSEHEESCPHIACFCPVPFCGFANSCKNLYAHFSSCHKPFAYSFTYGTNLYLHFETTQTHMILQERDEGVIFIVKHDIQRCKKVFNVDCIGPMTFKGAFVYQLSVRCLDTCLSLESVPEVCSKWPHHIPSKNYLAIPPDFFMNGPNGGRWLLQVCIRKAHLVT